MKPISFKFSLTAVAVTAALAACGGGGGGESTTTSTGSGTTTTTTTPSGQTLVANTGTSSGAASNTTGPLQSGLPAVQPVPTANVVVTSVTNPTYTDETLTAFNALNNWRGQMRFEEENGGTPLGVGLLTQQASLDALAANLSTSLPNLFSTDPALKAAAIAAAQAQVQAAGYAAGYVIPSLTSNTSNITIGNFCVKTMFSAVPGLELATSGMRVVGLSVPTTGNNCLAIAAIDSLATWQLPPTASSSVYPFPGKQLTLANYYGDPTALGYPAGTQLGHAVLVSLASNEALPVAVPGVGTGAAIPTSQITVLEFTLKEKASGATVVAKAFTQAGVGAGTGVTLTPTDQLLFPTSVLLVPEAPLKALTVYTATFRATVRGRTVTRTWDFTSA